MATKIINVLRDDRFEDIVNIFKKTYAEEFIFILPKKTRALNSHEHFAALSSLAEEQDKQISILTANAEINAIAQEYNIGILVNHGDDDDSEEEELAQPDKEESDYEEISANFEESDQEEAGEGEIGYDSTNPSDDITEEPDDEPVEVQPESFSYEKEEESTEQQGDFHIVTAAATNKRVINDIIKPSLPEEKVQVKVSKPAGLRKQPIEFKKEPRREITDEIANVWQSKREDWTLPGRPVWRSEMGFFESLLKPFRIAPKTLLIFLGIGAVALLGSVAYISMGEARIVIKPRAHQVDFNMTVLAADTFPSVDSNLRRIPGQLFSVQKKVEEEFMATGERDVAQKARGKIKVFNEYGTTPQVLIATTRFESENGLIFRTLTTVTVPGTKVQNGQITPGSIEVEVIADKPGESYNAPAGKFHISAFKEKGDMDRYTKFYGVSEAGMKGGIVGKSKVVTDQDYLSAKSKIEEKILNEINQELQKQATGLKVLNSSKPTIKQMVSSAQVDEAAEKFTFTAEAEVVTLGFRESDIHSLISSYIEKANNLHVLPEKLRIDYPEGHSIIDSKTLQFTVSVKGPAYSKVDTERIVGDLMGKDENQIKEYIKGMESVSSAKVILSPFWVKKVPADREKVKEELVYE